MIRRAAALVLILLCAVPLVQAAQTYTWQEGVITYPAGEEWVYRYTYRHPVLTGETPAASAINAWFDMAFSEMNDLILPMFAAEADMAGSGRNEVTQSYEVTCNNDRFFGILLTQTQALEDHTINSLSGQVFAVSGEYTGETLTLRGLLGVGESSAQIAEAILEDVYMSVQDLPGAEDRWPDAEALYDDFDPETQFYADEDGQAVFYLQPGVLEDFSEPMTFVYSAQAADALLGGQGEEHVP